MTGRLSVDPSSGVLVDCGECVGDVLEFLLKVCLVAKLVSSSDESVGD